MVIEERLPQSRHADGLKLTVRRKRGRRLGIQLGSQAFRGFAIRPDAAANGEAILAIVDPPGSVVLVNRNEADASSPIRPSPGGSRLSLRHLKHSPAHRLCTRKVVLQQRKSRKLLPVSNLRQSVEG